VAAGRPLSFRQGGVSQRGHAIEARICAEDPGSFVPSPGLIRRCRHPQGPFIRVDSYAYPGYEVPIYYDPMIAKLIAWGATREDAIRRLDRALTEFTLTGIKTNIALHKAILAHEKFRDGTYTTQFCEKDLVVQEPKLFRVVDDHVFLITAAIAAYNEKKAKAVSEYNVASRWKDLGRKQSLR
jgi:acetyl-CoA carboxylase biotin carboxylase subunit